MKQDCNFTSTNNGDGFIYIENGTQKLIALDKEDFIRAICHGLSQHGVNFSGGFNGGINSQAGSGVALGKNAKTKLPDRLIDAIQLGTGTNTDPYSLSVYGWKLLNSEGIIPLDRLPSNINSILNPIILEPIIYEFNTTTTVTVTHNQNKYVNFKIEDNEGYEVTPESYTRTDNELIINIHPAISGKVIVYLTKI